MNKCLWCQDGGLMEKYHDEEWGNVVHDDYKHFEYLSLEAMQCGLSWNIVIKKRKVIQECFANFDYNKVALFNENDIQRILNTPNMIKSIVKIKGIINNAQCFLKIIQEFGSFDKYFWSFSNNHVMVYLNHQKGLWETHNDISDKLSYDMKKRSFKYLGSVTLYSYMQACGMINDHELSCYKYPILLNEKNVKVVD